MNIAIIIWVVGSLILGILGRHHKFGFWGMLFCSILLTPIVGMLIYIAGCTGVRYRHERQMPDTGDEHSTPVAPSRG